jgi:hypothetical protein
MRLPEVIRSRQWYDPLVNVAPAIVALPLALIAVSLHYTADFGVAYVGGAEAWATGHPQSLVLWTGTPFLALVMGSVTRLAPAFVAARVFMAVNLSVWMLLLTTVWPRFRGRVPSTWWWATLAGGCLLAPAVSTIFWLQFNLVVFVMGLAGFVLAGRHDRTSGFLLGLSVALKPILILLPLAFLLRRRSRAAGIWAVVTGAVLTGFGFVFLAWRANDPHVLNPLDYLEGFLRNGRSPIAACIVENYSPVALLCRLGVGPSTAITVAIAAILVLAGWLLVRGLPQTPEGEWETFAAACFLSTMVGPIDWNHYGLLTGPLFVLLAYQFWRDGAPRPLWLGLLLAYGFTDLVWDPLSSLAGASIPLEIFTYTAGQFGQYFLLLTWIRWRRLRACPVEQPAARPARSGAAASS